MRRGLLPLALLAVLVLGVTNAGGHTLATTNVIVQVSGLSRVTSDIPGISCGDGKRACYVTFTGSADITLTASGTADGWSFDSWAACPGTASGDTCVLSANGVDKVVRADFRKSSGTTTSTLSVSYTGDGDVSAPERAPTGTEIDCGSGAGQTDCAWTDLTGSMLTVFETPDTTAGNVFSSWGGACNGKTAACTVQLNADAAVNATWTDASAATENLTVTVSGTGTVHRLGPNCDGPATCSTAEPANSTVVLTALPSAGFTFTGWTGACTGSSSTCTLTMDTDRAVTATFSAAIELGVNVVGNGNVSGGSGAINCGTGANVCSASFAANAVVTLVATPSTGALFTGWTGVCGGTATTCTVSMNQSKTVTATFTGGTTTPTTTGVSLSVSVSGSGTVTGGGITCGVGGSVCTNPNEVANSIVTLTATPAAGAAFTGWGGACTGTTPTCIVTFTSSKTVTASFSGGTSTFLLSVSVAGLGRVSGNGISCGNGASTCSANITAGATLTLSAAPGSGAKFSGWGGSCSGTVTSCTLTFTSSKSVSATFTGGGTPGTLTITAVGRGTVSTSAGSCAATGPSKTCVQHFKAGARATLTAKPQTGQKFSGWSGACTGAKSPCAVTLTAAQSVTATFTGNTGNAGNTPQAVLIALGAPVVKRSGAGFKVTLRINTTHGGIASVRGLRAGRTAASVSLRVAAGNATIGPFPVAKPGLYTFEIRLAGKVLRLRACLGLCGSAARAGPFVLTREAPTVTRTGDVWSVTLHVRSNQASDARIRAYRGGKVLINRHFLGAAARITLGPFLLGPGNYTLRLNAVDAFGRVRTLTWIVSLGR